MKSKSFRRRPLGASFTLIEMLVAISILAIMLIGLATAMTFVTRLWLSGIGAMDNFTKARVVLNLLDRDIQMMVLRRDMAAFVDASGNSVDNKGNSDCAFYSNVQGNPGTDTRTVSLVQYLLSNPAATPTLERLNYGMNFSTNSGAATPAIVTSLSATNMTQLGSANVQTETVFTGIIRFQIQFVDGNGAILTPTAGGTEPMTSGGPFTYDFVNPSDPLNPRAVIVSMLVLSNPAYQLATSGGTATAPTLTMTELLNDFPNTLPTSQPNQTFSQYWNSLLSPSTGAFDASLPVPVRAGIQVFERHIPLPITTPSS